MAERYECWGADKQDFTDLLRKKYDDGDMPVFYMSDGAERWKFKVSCSHGHENVFSGTGRP